MHKLDMPTFDIEPEEIYSHSWSDSSEVYSDSSEEKNQTEGSEADIIRQVEYYFSDANLMRDKFLLEKISESEEGWVPFTVLLTFKRLAALTTDIDVIVNALHKSDEGLVEISDDKMKIRRPPERPFPEPNNKAQKEVSSRTAYVNGFPLDTEISDLIEFFNSFEKVVNIVMREYFDKSTKSYNFKGSIFVTFSKKEQCEAFINKDKVEYKGTELIRKWQDQYSLNPFWELTEEEKKEVISRTAYAVGFPLDTKLSDLTEFFNSFEKVVHIYMRKYLDKSTQTYKFSGGVLVTFSEKEQCTMFINKDKVKYKGIDIIRNRQVSETEKEKKEVESRTAYTEGFPLDTEISDLIEFFHPFEKVVNIHMKKYFDKYTKTYKFSGIVLITFSKKEQCEAFINKDKVEYQGTELIRKWQDQYSLNPFWELTEEEKKEVISRTAYAVGFPLNTKLSDLTEFFHLFEKVVNINMRKNFDKFTKTYKFSGSVLITFSEKEQCEAFINMDKVEYEGTYIRKWQYFEEKRVRDAEKKDKVKLKDKVECKGTYIKGGKWQEQFNNDKNKKRKKKAPKKTAPKKNLKPENPFAKLNEEERKEVISRTAYVKGYPSDTETSYLTEFFHSFEGVVNIFFVRKYLDKSIYYNTGIAFVTFSKKEQ